MTLFNYKTRHLVGVLMLGLAMLLPGTQLMAAGHDIRGINGPNFNLYAFPFNMNLPEGTSLHMWGFGDMNAGATSSHPEGNGFVAPQYPAPTLIVNQGDTVTINMTNYGVPQPVSIVVAGQQVAASGGTAGMITRAANVGETVTYTFVASEAGTYLYHSLDGSNPGLHVEMGLVGTLIVRPTGYDKDTNRVAYTANGTDYDHEYLYLLTEIDPEVHLQVERGHYTHFTNNDRFAKVWFVNGRVFPDLFQGNYNPLFPNQPYQSLSLSHPGDRILVRAANGGHDSHPFHFHGENLTFIARDGRVLSSDSGVTADLGRSDNTLNSAPKQTVDMIWTWTGKNLGWDIYGHDTEHVCIDGDGDGFGDVSAGSTYEHEWCADHGKALSDKVTLPGVGDLALGGWWSGSPFLGDTGDMPPGEGGLNPFGGYFLVWHSHAEKELTTFDIFPGGSLSTVVVLPPYIPIQ
ncbi:MAG: multicopper oxidase domain-containing protein [Candidatus Sedimenticola sp. 20ELBAFRAG]